MPAFTLRKWYLDATGSDGATVIAYWAQLRYGLASLCSSSVLDARDPALNTRPLTSWRSAPPPRVLADRVVWRNDAIGFSGEWRRADAPPTERTLLRTPEGTVKWRVLADAAPADGRLARRGFAGTGYVEYLELTLPPWKLPIDDLRWGRAWAVSGATTHTMIWIDWRGPHPLTLVLHNLREMPVAAVTDDAVTARRAPGAPAVRLDLAPDTAPGGGSRVLRDGPLVTGALKGAPGLGKWAPASILAAHESKRLARCVLTVPDFGQLHGWAIHEVVRFRHGRIA